MARILYGIAGEGMGHAVRSRVVIEHLRKKHDVRVVAASRAYHYLSTYFPVDEIDYFKIVYRNNKAANVLTVLNNALRLPSILSQGRTIGKIIREFKPQVIITDFEPLVDYYALWKKIPVICIDNQHIITDANHGDIAKGYGIEKVLTRAVIGAFIVKSDMNIITSYYGVPSSKKNSVVVAPLIREDILGANPKDKGHILVYQTSTSNTALICELKKVDRKFIVYGLYEDRREGNVSLRNANEEQFLKDLTDCSAVITNGGFTLISEALHLGKPILCIPVEKQFEQILNALYLEKLGYGMYAKKTTKEAIEEFLKDTPQLKKNLQKYKRLTNENAFKKIDETIKLLTKRPGRSRARS